MNIIRKWIVAHRGDASCGSENTLAAFQGAINAGADMIELDVQQLADGVLVVFHDDEIGGEALANMSFAQFHDRALAHDVDVPTLQQTLDLCAGRIRLDVELKDRCEEDVVCAITESRLRIDEYVLTSFDEATLLNVRRCHPGIQTGLLTEKMDLEKAQIALARLAADFWAPDCKTLDNTVINRCEQLRIQLLPWNVNSDADLHRLLSAQCVTGVISDRTREALNLRRTLR